ncbi:methyl-accepting chemotaxis protein [Paraburkholderia unamae]|uniref:Methyl-accepting chemotaxis sensory transducer with Pas/Pac sensor n=1 Tax=Paraburkholderia unamae TaxID=219649 RepID=A0ABX5KUP2_9BURK|nr:PAS domain-containing methyl-accepting chemotaxis protein [Paraburkholderia unamae]PVX85613.1 methyl-accepting chemotaxis sensory transducer with Pas/Pac sensor [Paraburkholderia unamae]
MRNNQPVTQREYILSGNKTLVSVTDLKGRITYCNQAFIEASGFEREALLGQPHNIIRHPDMPPEAYRDLWATLQQGLPWSGFVKNRRKNGDHYWVQANATPMTDGPHITGYLSVRTVASRASIEAAERLYAVMREEARSGNLIHVLHGGEVVRRNWLGRIGRALKMGTGGKVLFAQIAAGSTLFGTVAAGLPLWTTAIATILSILAISHLVHTLAISPLDGLVDDANRLAAGDLSHVVTTAGKDAVGRAQQALLQMSLNLRTVVRDVRDEVDQLGVAIKEIAAGNSDLSARTESQASNLEQTAASMDQISGTVQQSAEAAERGASLARDTSRVTLQGNEAVEAVAETMEGIAGSSRQVSEIAQMIEGIAFQTNILALNAAVEAARAGEAGKGFAVVASEVRALAQRTSEATKEIKSVLADSVNRIMLGRDRTGDARERMKDVLGAVEKVSTALDEISVASTEQRTGVSQIGAAVTQMDALTQQNAAMVEELAAAAETLQERAAEVSSSMRLFRLERGEFSLSQIDAVTQRREAKRIVSD